MRPTRLIAAALAVCLLSGCTPSPAPAPTPTAVDFTAPGAAAAMVAQLMATAGTTRVIDVELTRTEARVSVLTGVDVATYAYRGQKILEIDTDIRYVGQAIFDPRSFALSDVGALFSQAAAISGSEQGQQLQIVDYDSGHIYMNVTTNPETLPVFFSPDGALLRPLDPTSVAETASQLDVLVADQPLVVRLGSASDGSVYADVTAGPGQIQHIVRSPRFPVRTQLKTDSAQPTPFDPSVVTADQLAQVLDRAYSHLDRSPEEPYDLVIERHGTDADPTASVTIGGKTIRLTLDGVILSA
ncbi:MAG: hypothetical protein FWD75_08885 [Propionibacteriaceae bacterium]|nr:hypothetical protein [Propionibacteriaceae bacterium]